jgi:transposase
MQGPRAMGVEVICLGARYAKAALAIQLNKNDRNDTEGLAHIVRTGWCCSVHVKSFEAHRLRARLGARQQRVGMTTQLSSHIRGISRWSCMRSGKAQVGLAYPDCNRTCDKLASCSEAKGPRYTC